MDHPILLSQLNHHFDDPLLRRYFHDSVTIGVDSGGQVFLPTKGNPRRSSLSPFFGALYLSSLDQAFSHRKGVFYLRYMDDIIVLVESKRQYLTAKRKLFAILKRVKVSNISA